MSSRGKLIGRIDWLTVFIWAFLVVFGWMNIYSANMMNGDGAIFDFSQRYGKQLIWIGITILLIVTIFLLDPKVYAFFAYPAYFSIILLLMLVLVFGKDINGARSWFVIGGFQFQPSEFAKPLTALALARLLTSHGFNIKRFGNLMQTGILIMAPALLVALQPDLGSTMVYLAFLLVLYREGFSQNIMILGVVLVILFILTLIINQAIIVGLVWFVGFLLYAVVLKFRSAAINFALPAIIVLGSLYLLELPGWITVSDFIWSVAGMAAGLLFMFIHALRIRSTDTHKISLGLIIAVVFVFSVDYAMNNVLKEHQRTRIYVTLGMEDDPQGVGYNLNQSKIAIGSGGFSGKGYLKGTQTKLQFVPEQSTDFIFCTVGEEWGFLGTSLIVLLYAGLIIRLVIIAERQRSNFSRVFGYGLVSILLAHFLVNIGMTIGLFPVIGIPLPFFSYGGSSFIAFSMFLFIYLKLDSFRMELLR